MNEVESITALAADADRSASTGSAMPDLAGRVLVEIRKRRTGESRSRRVWQTTAAATCVLAIVTALCAARSWSSLLNPLSDLVDAPGSMEMR